MLLGLCSRHYGAWLPGWVAVYAGDTLWALLVYWLLGLGWPSCPAKWRAVVAISFSFFIEVSQLYHPAWLEAARNTTLGSLVLGHGFLWSDLVCYTVGVLLGYVADQGLATKQLKPITQR
ncbi:DUF2809 domain-containing protein [Hymenobacter wooponensis]|uniref:DUF2809 domain-containing protein n=2 Tax=Hymenobacter wooponensis TaxID=1525360 RepID=A0A4Z0MNP8_9BACT|nr:DUF2809 domain-containing protein [Hymenobacter wooponensis]